MRWKGGITIKRAMTLISLTVVFLFIGLILVGLGQMGDCYTGARGIPCELGRRAFPLRVASVIVPTYLLAIAFTFWLWRKR